MPARTISHERRFNYRYSICTLVTDHAEYSEMTASFFAAGFLENDCEYLITDNTAGNQFDAYRGINRFLQESKGEYIILCHQDILLTDDTRGKLEACISELNQLDRTWAVLGNAGGINLKYIARHLNQASDVRKEAILPLKAISVDENFIVVKSDANLSVSSDLSGYHFYGTDICLIADILGYSSYIIDFRLTHKSPGNVDARFYQLKQDLLHKYGRALRSRFISTTIARFFISGSRTRQLLFNTGPFLFVARQYNKFFRPKKHYLPADLKVDK